MRVLVLSHQFPNDYEPSAGIYVLEQIRAARALGVDSTVMVPTAWVPPLLKKKPRFMKYTSLRGPVTIDGFPVRYPRVLTLPRARLFALSGLLFYLSCRAQMRALLHTVRVDLIHAHTIMPDGFAAILLGREFDLPVVCTVHGSDVNLYPSRDRLSYRCIRWALRRADHLIAVSDRLKEKSISIAGTRQVSVIHNGGDQRKFFPRDKMQARAMLDLPLDRKIILFVGNLWDVKGINYLLEALRRRARPDVILYVVGDGDIKQRLIQEAADAGLDCCRFVGYQPHNHIPLWLSAADCLVLPSLSEGLPTILCEAMLCKTPIIATDVGGVAEIVQNRVSGLLVPSRNADALADAISEQLSGSALTLAMVESAHDWAEQNLTWQANAAKLVPLYQDALLQAESHEHSSAHPSLLQT